MQHTHTKDANTNLPDLLQRWDSFDSRPFPSEGQELQSLETFVSMTYAKLIKHHSLDMRDVQLLWQCQEGLAKGIGSVTGIAKEYFTELEVLVRLAIMQVSTEPWLFSNILAVELKELLDKRVNESLSGSVEHFPAILEATISLVANVLHGPILLANDPDKARKELFRSTIEQLRKTVEQFTLPTSG